MSITIEVNGRTLEAEPGEMLIQTTDRNGIYIPRFCYHDKLSVAANCRMCLVEVERAPQPLPACATPVADGMKVFTHSHLATEAQKGTMEFLLINHPLDCPVCDQGGECPLQDQAMEYGKDHSRFVERKRSVPSHDIGPLVATEMTRCIHCTRCVRFGEEVAGLMEMGAPGRGEGVRISTFLNRSIDSEVSGNMVDLCPVGALTSRPFRFAARSWELRSHQAISPHDCLGTNLNVQTLRDQVERVLPIENPQINECWLADRDRFSYQAVNSEHRLLMPMIKTQGRWQETDWETALNKAAQSIREVVDSHGAAAVGGLINASPSLEEHYLLQKLLRAIGSENVDHRLLQQDFSDDHTGGGFPGSELPIAAYSNSESVVLVGSNIRKEQPLLALRLREGQMHRRTRISAINPLHYDFNFHLTSEEIAPGILLVNRLASLARAVAVLMDVALPDEIAALCDGCDLAAIAQHMCRCEGDSLVILGACSQNHHHAGSLKAITTWIADNAKCSIAILPPANSAAAHLAGCLPKGKGKNTRQMLMDGLQGYILFDTEPDLDSSYGSAAAASLNAAQSVVSIGAFKTDSLLQYATVLLPLAPFTESAGSYVNCTGLLQKSSAAASPRGESRPGWKILRVLGNFLDCPGFDQVTLDHVMDELNALPGFQNRSANCRSRESGCAVKSEQNHGALSPVAEMPMYRGESLLRHAEALQATADSPGARITLNPQTAVEHGLSTDRVQVIGGTVVATLPLTLHESVPEGVLHFPLGYAETAPLAAATARGEALTLAAAEDSYAA